MKQFNFLFLLILLHLIYGCKVNNIGQYKIIEYIDETKIIVGPEDNNLGNFKIAYHEKYTAYEVWSSSYKLISSEKAEDRIINKLVPSNDTTYKYFVVEKGKQRGIWYDGVKDSIPKVFRLDSLEEMLTIIKSNMAIFSLDLGKPIRIVANAKDKTKTEHYFTKTGEKDADSIYRFYDEKMTDIEFSFSPKLDNEKKSKLYKTLFIYLKKKKGTNIDSLKSERITSIKRLNIVNNQQLISAFEKFETDKRRFNLN